MRRLPSLGLRVHALILSGCLIFLTAFLGLREYQIARQHVVQMESLVQLQKELLPKYSANLAGKIEEHSQEKLQEAKHAALGLLRFIIFAMLVSSVITAWMVCLFYQGLLSPLRRLIAATDETSRGNLSYRLPPEGLGIFKFIELRELAELNRSYNSMAAQLEALDRAKAEFLQTVSHEIKNPLTALKEGMHLLANQGESLSPTGRQKTFNACLIAAKRLELMINNLLRLSRGETELYQLEIRHGSLNKAIQSAIDEVRPLFERKKMRIEFVSEREILAAFNWDGMVQVFVNLLLNAIKYGQESTAIRIQLGEKQKQIEIEIANSGKTIAASDLVRIFDRFYRGSNSTQTQGIGIGLHVVKQIVRAHQGEVAATSSAGLTRLQLKIPALRNPA